MKSFAGIGATLAFVAVAFGAFGAHALRERISPEMLTIFQTGVQYQTMHALALLILGLAAPDRPWIRRACWLFVGGIVLFSGSLYSLALTATRAFGAITPLGGICFLVGWGILAVAFLRES